MGMIYGYARVSSSDQNLARQIDSLKAFGVDEDAIFADKASGKDFNRPRCRALMSRLREGDVLVVGSIDRLGRNYEDILREWRRITQEAGAAVVVLDMPLLDTRRERDGLAGVLIADIVLQLLSYVAQVERENIHRRQAEGIAAAKARGVKFGRPTKLRRDAYEEAKQAYRAGMLSRREAARHLGVAASTFDRWLKADDEAMAGEIPDAVKACVETSSKGNDCVSALQ